MMKFLSNERALKTFKIISIITFALLIPVTYFFFPKQFDFEGLLQFELGLLLGISLISRVIIKSQVRELGFDIENEANEELVITEEGISSATEVILSDFDNSYDRLTKHTEDEQDRYNTILTNDKKKQLELKILGKKIKGKDYTKLQTELDVIKDTKLYDKSYVHERMDKLIGFEKNRFKRDKKNKRHVNVRKQGRVRSFGLNLFTTTLMGGAMLDFAWSGKLKELMIFIPTFLLTISIDSVLNYLMIRYKTRTQYLYDRKETLAILNKIKDTN